jgi:uncharacterized membrane protein YedE/YeeE
VKSIAVALLAGVLSGLGLVISGMTTPARVVGFLDVTGGWDPTLAFVMVAAIGVHAPLVWLARRRTAPWFDRTFWWPELRAIDPRLVVGSAIFGIGWGLSGYCPGPAIVSLPGGGFPVAAFVGAMLLGMLVTRLLVRDVRRGTPSSDSLS